MNEQTRRLTIAYHKCPGANVGAVHVADLRAAMGLDLDTFRKVLRQARMAGIISMAMQEGRHHPGDDEGIREGYGAVAPRKFALMVLTYQADNVKWF